MKSNKIVLIIICSFFILLFLSNYFSNESFENESTGFIITRHVNTEDANKIWVACVKQIRKSYPTRKIVIIDDHSNYDFVKVPPDYPNLLDNCIVVNSEHKGAGELLPYCYYSKNHWFDKAIFIHDSVFINGEIPTEDVKNVKFLWYFDCNIYTTDGGESERPSIEALLQHLNYKDELFELYSRNDCTGWVGAYGVMSVITHSYAVHLCEKYNLPILLNHVNKRIHRMAMERIFAILCFHDGAIRNETSTNVYGSPNMYHNYDSYFKDLEENKIGKDPVKLFFGR